MFPRLLQLPSARASAPRCQNPRQQPPSPHHHLHHSSRCAPPIVRRSMLVRALDNSGPDETSRYQDAFQSLGLPPGASFDQILVAKNKLLAAAGEDPAARERVEQAYDTILNGTLRRRLRGELDVSLNVRFADAGPRRLGPSQQRSSNAARPTRSSPSQQQQQQQQQQQHGSGPTSTLTLLQPREALAKQHVAVYGVLGTWTLLQAALQSPEAQMSELSAVQLSLAVAYSAYSLMDSKRLGPGRSVALSLAMLLMGVLMGVAVENVVQLDTHPLGTFHSPNTLYSEFGMLALLVGSLILL